MQGLGLRIWTWGLLRVCLRLRLPLSRMGSEEAQADAEAKTPHPEQRNWKTEY